MKRCGEAQKAVEMLTELNLWDQATALAAESRISTDMILKRKAQVQQSQNDTMAAANTYEQIGDFSKAIDLLISAQKPELLLAICAKMDHKHTSEFAKCISYFKKNQNVEYAIEAIEKLGDNAQLVKFLVDLKRWDEAFKVCETRPEYQAAIYLPYGYWLASNDRFDDAQAFFLKAGRADEAMRVMNQLLKVALGQECFDDVAFYYWSLAKSIFSEIHTQSPQLSEQDALKLEEAREYADLAELYHSYHKVYKYVQDPFTFSSLEHLFNISKFLIVKLEYRPVPPGISRAYILHTLAKVSKSLKCYRICRFALEKLQALNIPREWQQVVDLSTALIKATPETDSAHMNFNCFQCGYINQPFKAKLDSCSNCLEPFVRSLNMFEPLPLIEFVAAAGIAHNEAIKLINTISSTQAVYKDEALQLQLVLGERQSGYTPIVYDRQALLLLEPHKVMIRNTLKSLTPKFYQLVNSDVRVKQCRSCEYLFSEDEWNYQILIDAKCSFCRAECPAE